MEINLSEASRIDMIAQNFDACMLCDDVVLFSINICLAHSCRWLFEKKV
jgi:hypothetical protein